MENKMPAPRAQYKCDPEKNVNCRKTNCYLHGGPCTSTAHLEFAKQPVESVKLVIPMSKETAEELGFTEEKGYVRE